MGEAPTWPEIAALPATEVAPLLIGASGWSAVLHHGGVSVRLTEVEAYGGADDPGSHAYRGTTPRNRAMSGPPGTLYCYRIYGLHVCANLVCRASGEAGAVLLRAGAVLSGVGVAQERRPGMPVVALARGPGNLVRALGLTLDQDGSPVAAVTDPRGCAPALTWTPTPGLEIRRGPRVGLAGEGGDPQRYPWRFHVRGEPTVSAYRPAVRRDRRGRA